MNAITNYLYVCFENNKPVAAISAQFGGDLVSQTVSRWIQQKCVVRYMTEYTYKQIRDNDVRLARYLIDQSNPLK